jgi:hypothetical protein
MKPGKYSIVYWALKILSVIVSCALPIWAIGERYPIWFTKHGVIRSVSVGGILTILVIIIIFRRAVFGFLRERLRLRHAPPLLIWLVLIAIIYSLIFVARFLSDIADVFWMGFIGCAVGTLLTFIAENFLRGEKGDG